MAEHEAGRRPASEIQLATDVHHIEPVKENWARRLDLCNTRAECAAHHNAERQKQPPGGGRKSIG